MPRHRECAASTLGDAETDTRGVLWPQGLAPTEGARTAPSGRAVYSLARMPARVSVRGDGVCTAGWRGTRWLAGSQAVKLAGSGEVAAQPT